MGKKVRLGGFRGGRRRGTSEKAVVRKARHRMGSWQLRHLGRLALAPELRKYSQGWKWVRHVQWEVPEWRTSKVTLCFWWLTQIEVTFTMCWRMNNTEGPVRQRPEGR
jgi:hypothetical protein